MTNVVFVVPSVSLSPSSERNSVSHLISVDTAVVVTGVTKRTLWRWLGSGAIEHRGMDERGKTMLAYADIKPRLCISFEENEDIELL